MMKLVQLPLLRTSSQVAISLYSVDYGGRMRRASGYDPGDPGGLFCMVG